MPFNKLSEEQTGSRQSKNIVMLGAISELFLALLNRRSGKSIEKIFRNKPPEVTESNIKAMEAGTAYVQEHVEKFDPLTFEYESREARLVMQGNEAIAMGAIYAGLDLHAGYPHHPLHGDHGMDLPLSAAAGRHLHADGR
ncbi:MAG: 2-oxoacid:acceptor oxidoreductase family protein [Candidatus Marinimicrobia bacterium]|nr:2-oxoacid:acceptor oxidoreductase family protein [Candidatus Neomarinimicrobiota bacterium]